MIKVLILDRFGIIVEPITNTTVNMAEIRILKEKYGQIQVLQADTYADVTCVIQRQLDTPVKKQKTVNKPKKAIPSKSMKSKFENAEKLMHLESCRPALTSYPEGHMAEVIDLAVFRQKKAEQVA
jgi:hypothetical protein